MKDFKLYQLCEHKSFEGLDLEEVKLLEVPFIETEYESVPKFLGIKPNYSASYYIGVDWLSIEQNKAIIVTPKTRMENLDILRLFQTALELDVAASYFQKFYGFDFDKPKVEIDSTFDILSPMLIIHFVKCMEALLKRGLKKGYVRREENLKSKIKGHVLLCKHTMKNVYGYRKDRVYCGYQEYSPDIPENRLLKSALRYCELYLNNLSSHPFAHKLKVRVKKILSHFATVSDDIGVSEIRGMKKHKLFEKYEEALELAKNIRKQLGYSVNRKSMDRIYSPTFWIDMSRLYEVYVYSLLREKYGDTIKFQVRGFGKTAVDFLKIDECMVIDTKYKPQYSSKEENIIHDIRQISGYARDNKILEVLLRNQEYTSEAKCVIIYPEAYNEEKHEDKGVTSQFNLPDNLLSICEPIEAFREFYKIRITLPTLD